MTSILKFNVLCGKGGSSFVCLVWMMYVICSSALLKQEKTIRGKNRSEDESPNYFTLQESVVYRLVSSFSDLCFITEMHGPLSMQGEVRKKANWGEFALSPSAWFISHTLFLFHSSLLFLSLAFSQTRRHTKYKGLERPVSGVWTHHYQLQPGDLLNLTALLIDCNCMAAIDWLHLTQCNMHLLEVTGKGKGSNDFPFCPLANDPVQTLTDTLPYWRRKGYFCISLWIFCLPGKRRFWFPF